MKSRKLLPGLLSLLLSTAIAPAPFAAEAAAVAGGPTGAAAEGRENDPDFYLQLIAGMQERKLYFASLAHLDAFELRWPGNSRAALLRGDALRETGYLERAAVLYRSILKSAESAGAYHGLGLIASRQGDPAAALAALAKANHLAPTNAPILNDLGYAQMLAGNLDEARLSLHKATELDPKLGRAGANLALLYLLEGEEEKARSIMSWYQLPDAQRQEIERNAQKMRPDGGKIDGSSAIVGK